MTKSGLIPPQGPVSQRDRIQVFLMSLCGFLFSYVLTAGPMIVLHRRIQARSLKVVIESCYAPLFHFVKREIEPFASILKWYASLFS